MKKQENWDSVYTPMNRVGFELMDRATDCLFDKASRARLAGVNMKKCREFTLQALETYEKILTGDNLRRLQVTMRHLRGDLALVPLSLR